MGCEHVLPLDQMNLVSLITFCASLLSLLGSSFMICSILNYSKGTGLTKLILFLAVGDCIWSIGQIITFAFVFTEHYSYIACVSLRVVFQFSAGSTIFWTLCISFHLYWRFFSGEFNERFLSVYHLLAWGIPTLTCVVIVGGDFLEDGQTGVKVVCVPREPWLFLVWFFPLIGAMISTVIIYLFTFSPL
eukprot:TRINITY_DN804_c0_g2_i2.p1 TRINITY_DN804_c0_g2~~TRINITY_DN804_c0_g2_i2.p1  ORF type:complete len:189 (-),score=4.33 TRINITY_DN804_c0_g2_i2:889-1455(-)